MFMKFGVVAIAAFGAFAFNGTNIDSFRVDEGEGCRDIQVACSNAGNEMCKVQTVKGTYQVWSDLDCTIPIHHENSTPLPEL